MDQVRLGCRRRVEEIKSFAKCMAKLEPIFAMPGAADSRDEKEHFKIGCAALFLMIYNAIEFTVKKSINRIEEEISHKNIKYFKLNKYWRTELMRAQYLHPLREGCNYDTILSKIADEVNRDLGWPFGSHRIKRKTRNIGYKDISRLDQSLSLGLSVNDNIFSADLELIKTRRNSLSHGDESFSEAGSLVAIYDLNVLIDRVEIYLEDFIEKIEKYISEEKYLSE